jgi:hypothetical protein
MMPKALVLHNLTDCFRSNYKVPKVNGIIPCAVCAVTYNSRLEIMSHLSTHEDNDLYEYGFNKEMVII